MTASYQPLARKYRPGTFHELVGQESTATALANAIKLGREPHSVIFSGVRGIGKTTSARLYAKALNCDKGSSPEPCNQCESCLAITIGNHEDVIEIDGASNTSVDNIRSLRETISYVPQRSRFKIYIIDEVHMLSQSAFNALLKTLEEPPSHVVFVFATTELHKIPQTILSRCQVFFLQKLTVQAILERLSEVLRRENVSFDDKALACVAREGHGSMRDALTLLDHVIAVGNGHVSLTALEKIVSHVSSTPFIALLEALVDRNTHQVIRSLDQFEQGSIEIGVAAEKTAALARHASVARDVGIEHIDFKSLGLDDEEAKTLLAISKRSQALDLNRIFRSMVKCSTELDGSALDRYILENYCLEWCLDPGIFAGQPPGPKSAPISEPTAPLPNARQELAAPHVTASKAAIGKSLHSLLGELKAEPASQPPAPSKPLVPDESPPMTAKLNQSEIGTTGGSELTFPATWRELVDIWKRQKPLQARKLEEAHPVKFAPDSIELVIPDGGYVSDSLSRSEELKKIKDAFVELFGFKGTLTVSVKPKGASKQEPEAALPETLASIHEREASDRRAKSEHEAINHPLTRDAINLFGATINQVIIHDT